MPRPLPDLGKRTLTLETQRRAIDLPVDSAGHLLRYQPLPAQCVTRAVGDGGATTYRFEGQVTPFGARTWIGGRSWGFWEQMELGAFAKTIAEKRSENNDITFNREHDNQFILARTSNGTLRQTETEAGVQAEAEMGDYSYARDAVIALERRDLTGMSFAFGMVTYEWSIAEDGNDLLTHREVEQFDASIVGIPAYAQTSANLRMDLMSLARSRGFDVASLDRLARRLAEPDEHLIETLRTLSLDVSPAPAETTRETSQPAETTGAHPLSHLRYATLATRMDLLEEIAS